MLGPRGDEGCGQPGMTSASHPCGLAAWPRLPAAQTSGPQANKKALLLVNTSPHLAQVRSPLPSLSSKHTAPLFRGQTASLLDEVVSLQFQPQKTKVPGGEMESQPLRSEAGEVQVTSQGTIQTGGGIP